MDNTKAYDKSVFRSRRADILYMGDNRARSSDSRTCFEETRKKCENNEENHYLTIKNIQGKAWVVLWPFDFARVLDYRRSTLSRKIKLSIVIAKTKEVRSTTSRTPGSLNPSAGRDHAKESPVLEKHLYGCKNLVFIKPDAKIKTKHSKRAGQGEEQTDKEKGRASEEIRKDSNLLTTTTKGAQDKSPAMEIIVRYLL